MLKKSSDFHLEILDKNEFEKLIFIREKLSFQKMRDFFEIEVKKYNKKEL